MSNNSPPELKLLFETALNEFEKRTGTSLIQHPIIDRLINCESADSVIDILQERAQAFRSFLGVDGKLMTWLKQTVNVLYALSTSNVISGAISSVCLTHSCTGVHRHTFLQPFTPSNAIFAGIVILLGVSALPIFTLEDFVTPVASFRQ